MAGITATNARLRRVSHLSLPVYRSANASQAAGTVTIPRYSNLAQRILVPRSLLTSSRAYPRLHTEIASIMSATALAPEVSRRG